jgi:hypothetical protein
MDEPPAPLPRPTSRLRKERPVKTSTKAAGSKSSALKNFLRTGSVKSKELSGEKQAQAINEASNALLSNDAAALRQEGALRVEGKNGTKNAAETQARRGQSIKDIENMKPVDQFSIFKRVSKNAFTARDIYLVGDAQDDVAEVEKRFHQNYSAAQKRIVEVLIKTADHADTNKMGAGNIARAASQIVRNEAYERFEKTPKGKTPEENVMRARQGAQIMGDHNAAIRRFLHAAERAALGF